MVSYATQCVANAFTDPPHWQILEKYWKTAMKQNDIWSIAFEARTNEILKEVCWSNGLQWILHSQTGTRFEHKSIRLNSILFNQQGTTSQSFMISTALNPTQSIWNSLILFWQTVSIFFLSQSMWMVVYAVQIQRRESQKLLTNGQHTLHSLAEAIPRLIYIIFHHWANKHSKYGDGFYNSLIDNKDSHIPSPLTMFTCTT